MHTHTHTLSLSLSFLGLFSRTITQSVPIDGFEERMALKVFNATAAKPLLGRAQQLANQILIGCFKKFLKQKLEKHIFFIYLFFNSFFSTFVANRTFASSLSSGSSGNSSEFLWSMILE